MLKVNDVRQLVTCSALTGNCFAHLIRPIGYIFVFFFGGEIFYNHSLIAKPIDFRVRQCMIGSKVLRNDVTVYYF